MDRDRVQGRGGNGDRWATKGSKQGEARAGSGTRMGPDGTGRNRTGWDEWLEAVDTHLLHTTPAQQHMHAVGDDGKLATRPRDDDVKLADVDHLNDDRQNLRRCDGPGHGLRTSMDATNEVSRQIGMAAAWSGSHAASSLLSIAAAHLACLLCDELLDECLIKMNFLYVHIAIAHVDLRRKPLPFQHRLQLGLDEGVQHHGFQPKWDLTKSRNGSQLSTHPGWIPGNFGHLTQN